MSPATVMPDAVVRRATRIVPAPAERAVADPYWKRVLDIGLATPLSPFALVIVGIAAVAMKCSEGGPILFWQLRVGRDGRLFWFPKIRSMHVGASSLCPLLVRLNDHGDSITFKMRADPRVTRIGRLLRMLSLDELPQLWCVLKGDMSLVGPRPPLPSEVARYTPVQRRRLDVRPGITGLWQVSGRSKIPFEGQVALDLEYIDRHSLVMDLHILQRTVRAVVTCEGAW